MSAVMVHVSHVYTNMDMARERIRPDLGTDGDVLVVPDDFKFGHCRSPVVYFVLRSSI